MDSSNSATFTITLSDTAENKITASATDKVGNTMAPENYGSFANGAKIVHDITVPEIKADLAHFLCGYQYGRSYYILREAG